VCLQGTGLHCEAIPKTNLLVGGGGAVFLYFDGSKLSTERAGHPSKILRGSIQGKHVPLLYFQLIIFLEPVHGSLRQHPGYDYHKILLDGIGISHNSSRPYSRYPRILCDSIHDSIHSITWFFATTSKISQDSLIAPAYRTILRDNTQGILGFFTTALTAAFKGTVQIFAATSKVSQDSPWQH